jgi:hypothetical protein
MAIPEGKYSFAEVPTPSEVPEEEEEPARVVTA